MFGSVVIILILVELIQFTGSRISNRLIAKR
jgi:ABC-type methionine transport system permease subunit